MVEEEVSSEPLRKNSRKLIWVVSGVVIVGAVALFFLFFLNSGSDSPDSILEEAYSQWEDLSIEECKNTAENMICLNAIAIKQKDPQICQEFDSLSERGLTLDQIEDFLGKCYVEVTVSIEDSKICDMIDFSNKEKEGYYKSSCFLEIAKTTKDPLLCDKMITPIGATNSEYCKKLISGS